MEIVAQQRTHSRARARFWDVGLHPFVVPLLRWLARLDATTRLAVKRAFVATPRQPLVRLLAVAPADDCPHVMYLVRKHAS